MHKSSSKTPTNRITCLTHPPKLTKLVESLTNHLPVMEEKYRYQCIKKCTLVSALTNVLLTILKIVFGYLGHSQALIADGLHSFSDILSDGLVILAAKIGQKNPDQEHPYGHHRIETIAVVIISLILLAVGSIIVYEAILRFIHPHLKFKPDFIVLVVAAISVFANEGLYRYLIKIGEKIHSNLIISNAWHNRSDALTSVIVLISVVGSFFGSTYLDPIGAIMIALFILKTGLQLLFNSFNEMMDSAADKEIITQIKELISHTEGILSLHELRTRLHGGRIILDLHVIVSPKITVSEGHFISEQVRKNLMNNISQIADITIHIDPEDDELQPISSQLFSRQELHRQLKKRWAHLPAYDEIINLNLHYLEDTLHLEVYWPLSVLEHNTADQLYQLYTDAVKDLKKLAKINIFFQPTK